MKTNKTATLRIRKETGEDRIVRTDITVTGTAAGLSKKETELVAKVMYGSLSMLFVNGMQDAEATARKRVMRAPYIEFLLDHFRMDDETLACLD